MSTMTATSSNAESDQVFAVAHSGPTPVVVPDPTPAAAPAQTPAEKRAQWLGLARTLGLDVLGPILLQSKLPEHGWPEVHALMAAGALPLIGLAYDKARGRRLGGLSIIVLAGITLAIVLGLISGDARTMLLEGGIQSGAMAVFAVVTLFTRRTLVELFAGAVDPDTDAGRKVAEFFTRDDARRFARASTVVMACTFAVSSATQVALALWAPINVAFAYNRFGFVPCLAVMFGATAVVFRRACARGDFADLTAGRT